MMWLQFLFFLGFGFSWVTGGATTPAAIITTTESETKTELNWPDECKTGPKYWCQNLRSAKDCGAVEHCVQTVWMHQAVKELDDSSACKTCVDFITGFKNATTSNITLKQLEVILSTACDLLEPTILSKECEFLVKVSLPDLQTLIKKLDPHSFCCTVFLCNAATTSQDYFRVKNIAISSPSIESKPVIKEEKPTVPPPAASEVLPKKKLGCGNCYTLVTTGQKLFKKASRDDVLNGMIEMCGELSSFSDLCSANVITNFPTIYQHLDTLNVDDVCHLAGVCDELYHFHEPTLDLNAAVANAPDEANDEVCDFCLAMVNHLRDVVISNTTELEFKQVLEGICKQTGNFKDQCLQIVDQYYELIYQFLINELNPNEVCEDVKLCKPKGIVSVDVRKQIPLLPIVPSIVDLDDALKKETDADSSLITKVQLSRSDFNFSNPLALVGAKRCTWGPSYWCMNMTTSKECSGSLNHCIHDVWEKMELPADNGDICNICKDMIKQARDQLNSNETQEELREVFEGSCKLIPIKIAREECIKAVDEFVPELVETLSSQMNPQIVCATVGLCNSARMDLLLQQEKLRKSDAVLDAAQQKKVRQRGKQACQVCELLLHFVQQQMTLPSSEKEIKNVVNNVCIKLPHNVATECSSFIEVYGDAFISLLAQEIDPSLVCPRVGACGNRILIDHVRPTCPICLFALEALENKIADNKTEAAVVKALDTLCLEVPHNMIKDCERVIKNSADQIVDSVLADFSPQETCLYLKFCDASEEKTKDVSVEINPALIPRIEVDVATNEVEAPKDSDVAETADNRCVLCEFIMSKLDQELKDKKTADEIKNAVYGICRHMPSSVRQQCNAFVHQYADLVIQLLAYSLEPEQVCTELRLCHSPKTVLQSNTFVVSSQHVAQSSQTEKDQQLFMLYLCLGGFICMIMVLFAILKIRKVFAQNSAPYTRVTY